jgi:hypothetical protein
VKTEPSIHVRNHTGPTPGYHNRDNLSFISPNVHPSGA